MCVFFGFVKLFWEMVGICWDRVVGSVVFTMDDFSISTVYLLLVVMADVSMLCTWLGQLSMAVSLLWLDTGSLNDFEPTGMSML